MSICSRNFRYRSKSRTRPQPCRWQGPFGTRAARPGCFQALPRCAQMRLPWATISQHLPSVINRKRISRTSRVGTAAVVRSVSAYVKGRRWWAARTVEREGGMILRAERAIMLVDVLLPHALGAFAQKRRSEFSLQGTGSFTRDTAGQGISQRTTEAGGFLTGYRSH